jgi:hypothetical protein
MRVLTLMQLSVQKILRNVRCAMAKALMRVSRTAAATRAILTPDYVFAAMIIVILLNVPTVTELE